MKLSEVKTGEVFELWGETWKCVEFDYNIRNSGVTRRYQSTTNGHTLEFKGKMPDVEVFEPLEQEIRALLKWQHTTLTHKGVTIFASWRWGDEALVEYRINDWEAEDSNLHFWIIEEEAYKQMRTVLYASPLCEAHQAQIDDVITKYGPQKVDEVLKRCDTT